jgi:hypothetical protein
MATTFHHPNPPDHVGDPLSALRAVCVAAAELIDDLDGQRRREHAAFAEGYRLGFHAGHDVGHRAAHHEIETVWATLAARVRASVRQLAHDELEQRRYPGYTPRQLHRLRQAAAQRLGQRKHASPTSARPPTAHPRSTRAPDLGDAA